ncbi:MAG: hypothetical protein QG665_199 [Patescibacteria group bacterium]|nr:hypothetical protein [Patescibacteria group bacterium]
MFILLTLVAALCVQDSPASGESFAEACRVGFYTDHAESDTTFVWLGSAEVELRESGLLPPTDRCRQEEGSDPLPKQTLESVASQYYCDKPQATRPATAVAWVGYGGVVCVAIDHEVGEYEKTLLHLVAEPDGEEMSSDSYTAYGVRNIEDWVTASPGGEGFTIFAVGQADGEINIEEVLRPLVRLGVLSK